MNVNECWRFFARRGEKLSSILKILSRSFHSFSRVSLLVIIQKRSQKWNFSEPLQRATACPSARPNLSSTAASLKPPRETLDLRTFWHTRSVESCVMLSVLIKSWRHALKTNGRRWRNGLHVHVWALYSFKASFFNIIQTWFNLYRCLLLQCSVLRNSPNEF